MDLAWRFIFLASLGLDDPVVDSFVNDEARAALAKIPCDRVLLCTPESLNLQIPISISYSSQSSVSSCAACYSSARSMRDTGDLAQADEAHRSWTVMTCGYRQEATGCLVPLPRCSAKQAPSSILFLMLYVVRLMLLLLFLLISLLPTVRNGTWWKSITMLLKEVKRTSPTKYCACPASDIVLP